MLVLLICIALPSVAQSVSSNKPNAGFPNTVRFTGKVSKPIPESATAVFAIYKDQQGGAPLWIETQSISPDADGNYSILLGSTNIEGIPATIFSNTEARWLGIQIDQEPEQRVELVAVPYAMKAQDAETFSGRSISDFVLTPEAKNGGKSKSGVSTLSTANGTGTAGRIAKWIDSTTLGDSSLFELNGSVGLGTTNPTCGLVGGLSYPCFNAFGGIALGDVTGSSAKVRLQHENGVLVLRDLNATDRWWFALFPLAGSSTVAVFGGSGETGQSTLDVNGLLRVGGGAPIRSSNNVLKDTDPVVNGSITVTIPASSIAANACLLFGVLSAPSTSSVIVTYIGSSFATTWTSLSVRGIIWGSPTPNQASIEVCNPTNLTISYPQKQFTLRAVN
jgi:hypothetical protein